MAKNDDLFTTLRKRGPSKSVAKAGKKADQPPPPLVATSRIGAATVSTQISAK
jgi:hypothetical protein